MSTVNFNIDKASELSLTYKKNRSISKYQFIKLLISLQQFDEKTTILGQTHSTPIYYEKDIVERVLNDLGYSLVSFNYETYKDLNDTNYFLNTTFSFN